MLLLFGVYVLTKHLGIARDSGQRDFEVVSHCVGGITAVGEYLVLRFSVRIRHYRDDKRGQNGCQHQARCTKHRQKSEFIKERIRYCIIQNVLLRMSTQILPLDMVRLHIQPVNCVPVTAFYLLIKQFFKLIMFFVPVLIKI